MVYRRLTVSFLAWLGGALSGAVVFAWMTAGSIYDYEDSISLGGPLPRADVIVCLAGARGRISGAADLWFEYYSAFREGRVQKLPVLYLSGTGPHSTWAVLSKQVRGEVLQVLKPENVIVENQSVNTVDNASWFARRAKEEDWKKVVLVTSSYHMKRAGYIFDRLVFSHAGVDRIRTYTMLQDAFRMDTWRESALGIQVTLVEYIKWIYYRLFWKP